MTTMMPGSCFCALCESFTERLVLTSTNNFGGMDTEFSS